jgi:hypothetical protein
MSHTAKTVRALQAVAMTVGLAVFLWTTGLPTLFRYAEASSITNASDTLSNAAPGVGSNHTIVFTTPNGLSIGQTIQLVFDSNFIMSGIDEDDVDILINGSSSSTASTSSTGVWGVSVSGYTITFQTPTDSGVASTSIVTIRIGLHAVDFGTGNTQIVNPSATSSYPIEIGGTMQDSGEVRVAIIDQVQVTANVDTSLQFTIYGVNSGQTVNSSPTTTAATTTSVAIPFGTLDYDSKVLAQDLSVVTNAQNGYTVTVQQSGPLQSTTGGIIDGFIDGSNTQTPTAWVAPAALIADPATYGHWGLTSSDGNVPGRSAQFGADQWVSGSTTPIAIMGHTGPADGTTDGIGASRIGYQIEISPLQEAGDDYTTTLRYVATPTF